MTFIDYIFSAGRRLGLNQFSFLRRVADGVKNFLSDTNLPVALRIDGIKIAGMPLVNYISGTYEPETTALLRRVVHPGFVALDIGAQAGYFTLLLSKLVGPEGKVISFEPFEASYNLLTQNVRRNRLLNVEALPVGADEVGSTKTYYIPSNSLYSVKDERKKNKREDSTTVEVVRLDDYLPSITRRVDIIKIDIEGAEGAALRGMEGILRSNPQVGVVIEIAPKVMDKVGLVPEGLLEQLTGLGFRLFSIDAAGGLTERLGAEIVAEARRQRFINIYCARTVI